MYRYILLHKPYGMLSQFSREQQGDVTLADIRPSLPSDVYPVGRLDKDSEGLLLLTNDARLNQLLLLPSQAHTRTYWAQVEGVPDDAALGALLRGGVPISVSGRLYRTLPAVEAAVIQPEPDLPPRTPPVRFRKHIPTTWISLGLVEGKNRQVRKMTAAVGFPTLRLIRVSIGSLSIGELKPAQWRYLSAHEIAVLQRRE